MKSKLTKSLVGMIVALLLVATATTEVKSQLFSVGDKDLNFGIGFGRHWGYGKTVIPPISISLDYGFKDDIGPGVLSLGGYFGFASSKYNYTYYWASSDYGWKYTDVMVGARGTYHMEFIDKLDTYAGLILGIRYSSAKLYGDWGTYRADANDGIHPDYGFFVGGKYYLQDKLAIFGEIGYTIAYLTVGVTFKL